MRQTVLLSIFVGGIIALSLRFYTTASLERPVVLSALTLSWTGLGLLVYLRWTTGERLSVVPHLRRLFSRNRSKWGLSIVLALPACLVLRAFLFRQTIWWAQCITPDGYALLPFVLLVCEQKFSPPQQQHNYMALTTGSEALTPLRRKNLQQRLREKGRNLPRRYTGLAFVWGILASQSLVLTAQPTGAVCPANSWLPSPGTVPHFLVFWFDSMALGIMGRTLRWQHQSGYQHHQQTEEDAANAAHAAAKTTTTTNPPSNWAAGVAAQLLLAACAMVILLVVSAPFSATSLRELAGCPASLVARHLLVDSLLASAVLLSGACLLTHIMTPSTLTLLGSGVGIASYHIFKMVEEHDTVRFPVPGRRSMSLAPPAVGILAVVCIALLRDEALRFDAKVFGRGNPNPKLRRRLTVCLVILGAALQLTYTWPSLPYAHAHAHLNNNSNTSGNHVISLIKAAQRSSDVWTSQARTSHQLPAAVAEYKRRYGLPPPPNFDKWYAFATHHDSPVIDAFDQIHEDLLPFWGLTPSALRARTGHLLAAQEATRNKGMGGLRIRNGSSSSSSSSAALQISPGTPGTHRWMMEAYRLMIEPFVRYLPDMDLAFNIDDEPRVAVPAEDLVVQYMEPGRRARARLAASRENGHPLRPYYSEEADPPWRDDAFLDMEPHHDDPTKDPSTHQLSEEEEEEEEEEGEVYFSSRPRLPIYDTFIAPTCPPNSPAQRSKWWDSTRALPEARGGFLSSLPDLCDRPDLAHMHGFLLSPGAFAVTQQAMPLFSQSRADGFNDILVPSPWNFVDKVRLEEARDRAWMDKKDTVFWRGSASDGYARGNAWPGFLRARLVHLANSLHLFSGPIDTGTTVPAYDNDDNDNDTSTPTTTTTNIINPVVNVAFVNNFTRCDTSDCRAEATTFYSAPAVDFQDHWAHQHLLDLDGAGFSGRFLPFLRSRSAVYRASLFRTWYDERVHPWKHYIPVDVSLNGLWDLIQFVRGHHGVEPVITEERQSQSQSQSQSDQDGASESLAERVAADGRAWALQALRKEDMQVYMFRLLLEWGRLVDDARDELGYDVY